MQHFFVFVLFIHIGFVGNQDHAERTALKSDTCMHTKHAAGVTFRTCAHQTHSRSGIIPPLVGVSAAKSLSMSLSKVVPILVAG